MTNSKTGEQAQQKPLRLWPGVVIVTFMWLVRYVMPGFIPDALIFGLIGGVFGGALAIAVWWLFLSRAPWIERVGVIVLIIVALAATSQIIHESIATAGQGMFFIIYAIPIMSLALVVWAVVSRRFSDGSRRAALVATILLVCGGWTLLRIDGITGDFGADFKWRWAETAEERLLAETGNVPIAAVQGKPATLHKDSTAIEVSKKHPVAQSEDKSAALVSGSAVEKKIPDEPRAADAIDKRIALEAAKTAANWPGFRGPNRDGIIPGVQIETDWSASPPVELWRRPVGPGVSSFAVHGDLFYTQEQRGDEETVACYKLTTGEPVWLHGDSARFWDSHAGAGPRGTPTLSPDGRSVYTFGATAIVNALDAKDGSVVWSRNAAMDAKVKIPEAWWGFASSPLVVDDLVIIAAGGKLVAYDVATGDPRWFGPDSGYGYSSPHLMTIDGIAQILLQYGPGVISVAPVDGALLWQHRWPGAFLLQPALIPEHRNDILVGAGDTGGIGIRRIAVAHGPGGWTTEERWTSNGLKPYFNDFVAHNGHAFGFDGSILSCIDLTDGKRKWKGGRYGAGQMVLLPDQDLLLVVSERGELALVAAAPEQFTELARFPALKGKTWNHPVLVGDILLIRNSQEMAAFRLSRLHS